MRSSIRTTSSVLFTLLSAFAIGACSGPPTSEDGSSQGDAIVTDTAHDVAMDTAMDSGPDQDVPTPTDSGTDTATDTGTDARPAGSVALYGHCGGNTECMSGMCYTSWPGGMCSRTCTADGDCGAIGVCVLSGGTSGVCVMRCTTGGGQCPSDTMCQRAGTDTLGCFPSCTPNATGDGACLDGRVCEPYVLSCVTSVGTGYDNGLGCTADVQCRGGRCVLPVNNGVPTGYVGGYCYSVARSVSLSEFRDGQPFPQSNCPPGSAATPAGSAATGDPTICLKRCNVDTDCRQGYQCNHTLLGGSAASDGVCEPINCANPPPGRGCPAGTTCMTGANGAMVCG